ncbi:hypothetical protein E4O93_13345 [Diaphorobacter sp. DS2]|uniref:Uncharacterized protein n=1 Tax=Cytobacillus oceanisediminis TaxID=665099 RepID=A0ABX3CM87_9BACI|nr:hypothetical protein [Cytobacillus oceanisediminis]EFV75060.1 hypothetical protein HMPREF1013_04705 [Bacillus sp. 2_A_57_CT2]OHX44606.1 hypothetical protein BBV17_25625 [Cytobacillus oceanisediminis]TFI47312.1 hypothetical protein E4O93_13345 [Diaphorobacter sp. DS2]
MKTITLNLRESVFNNEAEAKMYVTKDEEIEPVLYVFSIPMLTFSWSAHDETDLDSFYPVSVFGDQQKDQKLLIEMKHALELLSEDLAIVKSV